MFIPKSIESLKRIIEHTFFCYSHVLTIVHFQKWCPIFDNSTLCRFPKNPLIVLIFGQKSIQFCIYPLETWQPMLPYYSQSRIQNSVLCLQSAASSWVIFGLTRFFWPGKVQIPTWLASKALLLPTIAWIWTIRYDIIIF